MKLSEDLMKQYKNSFNNAPALQGRGASASSSAAGAANISGIELKVSVLTSGVWPGPPGAPCELPVEIQECCNRFETFYLAKHTGRRLSWQPHHGHADIKAMMKSKHELNVTTYQMCILMLFNTHQQCSYQELKEFTNIPVDDLKRHL